MNDFGKNKNIRISVPRDDFGTIMYCMEHTLNDSEDEDERRKIRQAYHPLLDVWHKVI